MAANARDRDVGERRISVSAFASTCVAMANTVGCCWSARRVSGRGRTNTFWIF